MGARLDWALALWVLVLAKPRSNALFVAGLLAVLLGAALRLWAAGTSAAPEENGRPSPLRREGPYSIVRHPGVLGAMTVLAGLVLMSASWASWKHILRTVLVAAGAAAVVRHRLLPHLEREEADLEGAFPDEWRSYRRAVPRLLPRRGRWRPKGGSWSLGPAARREAWRLAAFLLFAFILRVKMTYRL